MDSVGRGWHPLLRRLHEQLIAVNPDYQVRQLKEKWGMLRIYLATGLQRGDFIETGRLPDEQESQRMAREDDEARRLVRAAEEESGRICESCGEPGEARKERWIKTLCDDCHTARQARCGRPGS
ncbi:hypothetical protein [Actinomadura vinacea]